MLLHHFSEDDSIQLFEPHIPKTNPAQPPAVWAIDSEHAPLYWFPRDCPRVAVWPRDEAGPSVFQEVFCTAARRLHVMEFSWLEKMMSTSLYRYDFDAADFGPWAEASGQWISAATVDPVGCSPVGDLLDLHRQASIELRLVDSLLPIAAIAEDDRWDFSMVRLRYASARSDH